MKPNDALGPCNEANEMGKSVAQQVRRRDACLSLNHVTLMSPSNDAKMSIYIYGCIDKTVI